MSVGRLISVLLPQGHGRLGDQWLACEAVPPVLDSHHACSEIGSGDLCCAHCGEPMHAGDVDLLPGPGAAV